MSKREWRAEIKAREGKRPKLVPEERPWIGEEAEECVICDQPTRYWLQPENVPLCASPTSCLDQYLRDPSVYDPRGLYVKKTKVLGDV